MTSRMIFQSLTWLAVMAVTYAFWFGVRHAVEAVRVFEASEAETYGKGTKYWLLAWRSAVFDNVKAEIGKVASFTQSYGGRYTGLGLRP